MFFWESVLLYSPTNKYSKSLIWGFLGFREVNQTVCYRNTLWYNCVCFLSRFVIFIWTLEGRDMSLGKDAKSFVITCSTFVNPESSITNMHSPLMNASPRIRLYFDILSNKLLKKGPAHVDRSLSLCQSTFTPLQQPGRRLTNTDYQWLTKGLVNISNANHTRSARSARCWLVFFCKNCHLRNKFCLHLILSNLIL